MVCQHLTPWLVSRCVGLAIVVAIIFSPCAIYAEEFVSNQYGFRFRIPANFREHTDNTPTVVKAFAETDDGVSDYPITINFSHVGQQVNPSAAFDASHLPHKEGWAFSIATARKWQEIDLPTVRWEAPLTPNTPFVGYLVQFPLKGEAIQLLVHGPKSREQEVLMVFAGAVESFVNLKPYLVRSEPVGSGNSAQLAINTLLPVAIGAFIISWLVRIRKSQIKPTGIRNSDEQQTPPELANDIRHTDVSKTQQRPIGITLLALLNLVLGVLVICRRMQAIMDVYSHAEGSVTIANSLKVVIFAEFAVALVAILSSIGMFTGTKWGWWLGALHWSWHLCRQGLLPVVLSFVTGQPFNSISGSELRGKIAQSLLFYCLFLMYMFKSNVLDYFGLRRFNKLWLLLGVLGAGMALSFCFHLLIKAAQ